MIIKYAIKKWFVSDTLNSDGNFVEIKGKAGGFISWALSKLGINPVVTMTLCEDALSFETGSWSGKIKRIIPYKSISSLRFGLYRPWRESVVAFFVIFYIFFIGIAIHHVISFFVALVLSFIYYLFNHSLMIAIYENSCKKSAIYFKPSVLDGHRLNNEDISKVCEILYLKVRDAK